MIYYDINDKNRTFIAKTPKSGVQLKKADLEGQELLNTVILLGHGSMISWDLAGSTLSFSEA